MPKKGKAAKPASGAEKPKEPAKKKREGPISLHPLSFEEAVRGLLQVKMEPEEGKPKRSLRKPGNAP